MSPPRYEAPSGKRIPLTVTPRLASWMRADHPDQIRLAGFLDHVESVAAPEMEKLGDHLALQLDVGLPPTVDLLQHHDLDNYLYPLICRLGSGRFASVRGIKTTGNASAICIDRATPADDQAAETYLVRTSRSAESRAWMRSIQEQLVGAKQLQPGPLELDLSFRVGPARNWANLWKRTIDSLDPILGRERANQDWNPRDGRIVRLGLHREVDPELGHDIEISIFVRPQKIE